MITRRRLNPAVALMTMLSVVLAVQSINQAQITNSQLPQKNPSTEKMPTQNTPPQVLKLFSALASDVVTGDTNSNQPEISAAAIPRGGKCGGTGGTRSRNALLIGSVGHESSTPNAYVPWSYFRLGLNPDFTANGTPTDLVPSLNQALPANSKYYPATDNQIVRLSNGDLIAARMSYIERNVAPYWNGTSGGRVGLLTVRSTDCGATWQYNGFLDPAKITLKFKNKSFVGAGGYPQRDWADTAKTTAQLIQGGGDRQEFYADPWDGQTVYATLWFGGNDDRTNGGAVNSALPSVVNALIFSSPDGGQTWGSEPIAMFKNNPVPIAMTTTRARHLYLFNCVDSTPTLHFVKDGKYVRSWPVFFGDSKDPENACAGSLTKADASKLTNPGSLSRVLQDVSISRVDGSDTRDTVRVVYPAVRGGRRVANVVVVRIQEAPKINVDKLGDSSKTGTMLLFSKLHEETIAATSNIGNIIYPTFIETDRVDLLKNSGINTAVLYWYETSSVAVSPGQPASVRLFTRYSVFRENGSGAGGIGSKPQDLSLTNGTRRYWSPANGEFIGDYMRGAFAFDGKLHFIAQWPERSGGFLRVRYNVVTVEP